MPSERERKANNALGICFLCLLALLETVVAHQRWPSPASPYIWSGLGVTAVASLGYYLRHRAKKPRPTR